jgi:succinylarginine dihydrolase
MDITRRNALKIIGATPVAAGLGLGNAASEEAQAGQSAPPKPPAAARKGPYKP